VVVAKDCWFGKSRLHTPYQFLRKLTQNPIKPPKTAFCGAKKASQPAGNPGKFPTLLIFPAYLRLY